MAALTLGMTSSASSDMERFIRSLSVPVLRRQHQRAEVADFVPQRQDLLGHRLRAAVDRVVVADGFVGELSRIVALVHDEGPPSSRRARKILKR